MTNVTGFFQYLQGMSHFLFRLINFKFLENAISQAFCPRSFKKNYSRGNGVSYPCQPHHIQPANYESMGATTTTPNGHSVTIIDMNNFSQNSNSSSMTNNNHSNNINNHKNETRLALPLPSSKVNSVAPMSDPKNLIETMIVTNEKDNEKLFIRSDKGSTSSSSEKQEQTENSSNTHLLNHNSETMNV